MSSYFDAAASSIRIALEGVIDTQDQLDQILLIESRVVHEVMLLVGDPEFPADIRDIIIGTITEFGILPRALRLQGCSTKMQQMSQVLLQSWLIERLHLLFHTVATRRIRTRFGLLHDHPLQALASRAEYLKEHNGSQ